MRANDLPWPRWVQALMYVLGAVIVAAILLPLILWAREDARQATSRNNLKQLGLAFHNYHDVYSCFPPGGTFTANDTPMHGWGTALIPYIDSNPWYPRVNLEEPWDDPFNRAVFQLKWPVYLNPQVELVQTADGFGLLHYPGNAALLSPNGSARIKDIAVGLSDVWICSEAFEKWQPWGSPFNWRELDWPPPIAEGEAGWSDGGAHLLMADGRVVFFSNDASQDQAFREMIRWKPDLPVPAVDVEFPEWNYEPSVSPRNMSDEQAARLNDTIALYHEHYADVPSVTAEELKQAVRENPAARVLLTEGLDLNRKTLPSVLQLKKLECLSMATINLSDDDLQQLAEFRSLRILDAAADEATANRLQELLPECELRLHLVDGTEDAE